MLRAVAQLGFTEVLTLPFASSEELDQLGVAADDPRRAGTIPSTKGSLGD